LVILEVLLLLATLLLFIITDSRTIRYLANSTNHITRISYANIEGNLFDGLQITDLRYQDKALFSSATIHWNPLTLFYDKVTITQIDAQGIEVNNILAILNTFNRQESSSNNHLDYSISINLSHFDVNPFVYKGVKFSSVVLESGKIEVDKDLQINTDKLYLNFDSDIVNLELHGEIKESILLVDDLKLEEISSKEITKISRHLQQQNIKKYEENSEKNSSENTLMPIKEIQVKHLLATLKPVKYGSVQIKNAQIDLYDMNINPNNNFLYQVKKLNFVGSTNFGSFNYKGYVKDANSYAKGNIELNKELFKHYKIPLNHKELQTLASELRLNHDAIWIDIKEHQVKNLLALDSDFNIDITNAKHKMHYDYTTDRFGVESTIMGSMNYAETFTIKNELEVKNGDVLFQGDLKLNKSQNLPKIVTDYLVKDLKGTYKGTDKMLDLEFENNLLLGKLKLFNAYQNAEIDFKSKQKNISISQFTSSLPPSLHMHKFALDANVKLDINSLEKSNIKLLAHSKILDFEAKMKISEPYSVDFLTKIKEPTLLENSFPNIQFSNLETGIGNILLEDDLYKISFKNQDLKLDLNYNVKREQIEKGNLTFATHSLNFAHQNDGSLALETSTTNLQSYFQQLSHYYNIKFPNLQGDATLNVHQKAENEYTISFNSEQLKYLSDDDVKLSVTNLYDVKLDFTIKNSSEIEIEGYRFRIDENEYLSNFSANKKSFLTLQGESIILEKLWVNDQVIVRGNYNLKSLQGILNVEATPYVFRNKDFDLSSNIGVSVKLNGDKIDVDGKIDLLGKSITYEMLGNGIVEDSDIVILEEMLIKEESALKNLKLYLKIQNKEPITYRSEDVDVEFMSDISVLKNYGQEMMITGSSTITKGSYRLEDKTFLINKSHLYFTGDVKNPLLDIKASYSKDEYNVHVFISGTTDAPIVNFNSEPFLTQQQIMSLILFDGTGSSQGTGAEAYTILGGTFAKGLIKSLGIDVDHLLLGQNEEQELSLEVGKKISEDISVLYLRKDGLDGVKVRLEHSKSFETDIIIQPPNTSSIEFLYKRDR
jgi:hypothetical protein